MRGSSNASLAYNAYFLYSYFWYRFRYHLFLRLYGLRRPLTLTLSPAYRGEGTRLFHRSTLCPPVNFVVFGTDEVFNLTTHEDRLLRLWRCRGLPIPRLEGLHHSRTTGTRFYLEKGLRFRSGYRNHRFLSRLIWSGRLRIPSLVKNQRGRWGTRRARCDLIAFSCVFRQRDLEKPVISCPLTCFRPLPLRCPLPY